MTIKLHPLTKDLTGETINGWYIKEFLGYSSPNKQGKRRSKWKVICKNGHGCIQTGSAIAQKGCSQCMSKYPNGKYVTGSFLANLERVASIESSHTKIRQVKVDIQYLDNLIEKQNFKCALSGVKLNYPIYSRSTVSQAKSYNKNPNKARTESNASLDRIDSTKDYIPGNVQWIYYPLNAMKNTMKDKEFINLCKMVADYQNGK